MGGFRVMAQLFTWHQCPFMLPTYLVPQCLLCSSSLLCFISILSLRWIYPGGWICFIYSAWRLCLTRWYHGEEIQTQNAHFLTCCTNQDNTDCSPDWQVVERSNQIGVKSPEKKKKVLREFDGLVYNRTFSLLCSSRVLASNNVTWLLVLWIILFFFFFHNGDKLREQILDQKRHRFWSCGNFYFV